MKALLDEGGSRMSEPLGTFTRIRSIRVGAQDWGSSLVLVIFLGLMAVVYYGLGPLGSGHLATGLLLSGACLLGGVFLGFLFGIPRSLQAAGTVPVEASSQEETKPEEEQKESNSRTRFEYRANTNLEQISDWLTKILVGVGLTQINKVPELFDRAGTYFGPSLGGPNDGERFAVVIILFFVITGFLLGYLWTRIFLGGELARGDRIALEAVTAKFQAYEVQREQLSEIDAKAIGMAYQYLSPGNENRCSSGDLKAAIMNASAPVKVQLFYQARALRSSSWQHAEDKPNIELTIPIFEALIASDREDRFHSNYGQLGFALKDKRKPDYARAEAVLTKAIEIRGSAKDNGWVLYEFNRAICRIRQDPNFARKSPSTPENRAQIWSDIDIVRELHPELLQKDDTDVDLKNWQDLNPR
jgi:hypothetical protein